jgi:hypothetical protein
VPVESRRGFDLLVARQLIWVPYAGTSVRAFLLTENDEPICPVCAEVVATGAASVVGMAVLADPALRRQLRTDRAAMFGRPPDRREAWWLVHGDCFDALTPDRIAVLNQRIELALRAELRAN